MEAESKIAYIVTPCGPKGGGMGRIKDYILLSGGDRQGRVRFEVLDSRGNESAIYSIPLTLKAIRSIWQAAQDKRVAFVHVNMAERGSLIRKGLVIFCARAAGLPVVLHLHAAELIRHYQNANGIVRLLIRLPFRMATCCVVLGYLWRDWLVQDLGIDLRKVEVVYNGVPVAFEPKPNAAFSQSEPCRFLFLGNMQERKGLSDFLKALSALPQDCAWKTVIAGGGDIAFYKKQAEDLGLSSRVDFTGWVDQADASRLLRDASALVLPSYEEGLPLVILEALGSGTPVVTTPVGAIPEILEQGRTVLFVSPGNPADIAETLKKLIQNPSLRKSLSEQGLLLYRSRFTLACFVRNLFSVYRRHCGTEIESGLSEG